jgi:hypothetical protein
MQVAAGLVLPPTAGDQKKTIPNAFGQITIWGSTAAGAELNWPTLPQKTSSKEEITESY